MSAPQNFKNHTRFDPKFHFFVLPVLLANAIAAIVVTVRQWPDHVGSHLWLVVVAVALFMTAGIARGYALQNQDRIIRIEERLRLAALVPAEQLLELDSLTLPQYVALRFASNPELPALARRAIRENLTPKQIKESIVSWRADNDRV